MTNTITPFEVDIAEQPEALNRLAVQAPEFPTGFADGAWDRIVLTGMGSSYFAGIPTWRALAKAGFAVWNVDAGQLLDSPELLTAKTLLVITSQSGASGEVVELLKMRERGDFEVATVVGIADPQHSPLAEAADIFLPLRSGPEATVSTKSYLNTVAVHRFLLAALTGAPTDGLLGELNSASEHIQTLIEHTEVESLAGMIADHPRRRLAFVGRKDHASTALFAALITKESSKVPAEGFIGGQFRHGPFELAGDGLTVVLFGMTAANPDDSLRTLASELVNSGSRVVVVGDDIIPGAVTVPSFGAGGTDTLWGDAVIAQLLAVGLARANGVVPGAFLYGSKITTTV